MSEHRMQPEWYTLQDIADKVQLSKQTLKRYAPYIPGRKAFTKRTVRYKAVLVDQWIEQGMPTPQLRIAS